MPYWNYLTSIKKSSTREGFAFLEFSFSAVNCQINLIDTSKQLQVLQTYIFMFDFRLLCHTQRVNFILNRHQIPFIPPPLAEFSVHFWSLFHEQGHLVFHSIDKTVCQNQAQSFTTFSPVYVAFVTSTYFDQSESSWIIPRWRSAASFFVFSVTKIC